MQQGISMKINHLPARTWNYLRMNETELEEVMADRECPVKMDIPLQISMTEKKAPDLRHIRTGMGSGMDELTDLSGIGVRQATVPDGYQEGPPLRMRFDYENGMHAVDRLEICAGRNSALTVIMDFTSEDEAEGLGAVQTRISAEEGALVRLVQILRTGKKYRCLNDIGALCHANAGVEVIQLVLGGKQTALGCCTQLFGEGSAFLADIGYLLGESQELDMNYVALHEGKKTTSRTNASGALRGRARKLFRGTLDFKNGCSGSEGAEKEDVLLLDDTVINQTIPLILCREEDVAGSHGATIGRLDDELLFYMQARGIGQKEVYEMMAQARIDAVCAKIPDIGTRQSVQKYLKGGEQDESNQQNPEGFSHSLKK